MNVLVLLFLVANGLALLAVPRRWAIVPLLVTGCYMTRVGVDLGPVTFTVLRVLVCLGLARVIIRGELAGLKYRSVDLWMALWAFWMVGSVAFHRDPGAQLVTRLGFAVDGFGLYLLLRAFCAGDTPLRICSLLGIICLPLAVEMTIEKLTAYNAFSWLGGAPVTPIIRDGKVRAQGPFDNAILAGTVGATCLLVSVAISTANRLRGALAALAAVAMIVASTSSGPILTAGWGFLALLVWPLRQHVKLFRWGIVAFYFALMAVMNDPPYFLMARIDLTGSSTGFHRARIIQVAFERIDEWWLAGTDYTRHWMPYGIQWSPDHADITNHYLQMGVLGGLPLMALFVLVLAAAFSALGKAVKAETNAQAAFVIWVLGATLFAHTVTFMSVSYYDQSAMFFYLPVAMVASLTPQAIATRRAVLVTGRKSRRQTRNALIHSHAMAQRL